MENDLKARAKQCYNALFDAIYMNSEKEVPFTDDELASAENAYLEEWRLNTWNGLQAFIEADK